jgi:hypothetical protein
MDVNNCNIFNAVIIRNCGVISHIDGGEKSSWELWLWAWGSCIGQVSGGGGGGWM